MNCKERLHVYRDCIRRVRPQAAIAVLVLALALTVAPEAVETTAAAPSTYTVLHIFSSGADGANPDAAVLLDRTGLYGTTYHGGGSGDGGTVFKIDRAGQETIVHSFSGRFGHYAGGEGPLAGLIRDAAGNIYGTTFLGGAVNLEGTVFKLDPSGKETLLHSFTGSPDGQQPHAGLLRDSAGNLFGTTEVGGTCSYNVKSGCGTVFKLDSAGKVTVLHSFIFWDGDQPSGGLVEDPAGNLYGTTSQGASSHCAGQGCGTVFKLDTAGNETVLHVFTNGKDGGHPDASLIRDAAGNLYGTTDSGGTYVSGGTVFKMDTAGKETVLYNFTGGTDGGSPTGSVIQDAAGNLYGTTEFGGDPSCHVYGFTCGTVFKLDTSGRETVLHSFTGPRDGALPMAGLTMDAAGNLYGTTDSGGTTTCFSTGCGVVFEIKH